MSSAAPLTRPATRPRAHVAPWLRVVDVPVRRRPRLAYGLAAVAAALMIVGAQVALSVATTQSSYELARLDSAQHQLTLQKQVLTDEVTGLSSPQYLAANAAALGMVISQSPSYLRLSDGALLGTGGAASGTSSVDPLRHGSVANKLIATTPLVTDPAATIDGAAGTPATGTDPVTPLPVSEGLPAVRTH